MVRVKVTVLENKGNNCAAILL